MGAHSYIVVVPPLLQHSCHTLYGHHCQLQESGLFFAAAALKSFVATFYVLNLNDWRKMGQQRLLVIWPFQGAFDGSKGSVMLFAVRLVLSTASLLASNRSPRFFRWSPPRRRRWHQVIALDSMTDPSTFFTQRLVACQSCVQRCWPARMGPLR